MELTDKTQIGKIERRTVSHKVELRDASEESRTVVGYAAKYDQRSEDFPGNWYEIIDKGAFDEVLNDDVRALFNHDNNKILARSSSGTLKLSLDEVGLKYEFEAPNTTAGNDLLVSIRRGDITQSSFGFKVEKDELRKSEGKTVRHITKVKQLFDVSPVTYPAYTTTEVTVRSINQFNEPAPTEPTESDINAKAVRERHLYLLSISL